MKLGLGAPSASNVLFYLMSNVLYYLRPELQDLNLFMNKSKTEFTHVFLADTQEDDKEDVELRGKEKWIKSKILGSLLLCSSSDITARCIMGNIAFHSYWKLWIRDSKISLTTKIRLYDATWVSLKLYNCNRWATPKIFLDKLNPCHRKHLRTLTMAT